MAVLKEKLKLTELELDTARSESGKTNTDRQTSSGDTSTMTDDWVNEEGEMMMAYQSAKDTNRLLEAQLQAMHKNFKLQEKELRDEISKHQNEIEKQQRIISEVGSRKFEIFIANLELVNTGIYSSIK